jgi:hypothetical protein
MPMDTYTNGRLATAAPVISTAIAAALRTALTRINVRPPSARRDLQAAS